MKQRLLFFLMVLSSIIATGAIGLEHARGDSQDVLKLTLAPTKESYKLGEKIDFSFALTNISKTEVRLMDVFGTGTGFLNVECTTNGEKIGCSDPGWGTIDIVITDPPRVKSGETIFADASILWNWQIQDIPTYTFLKSGVYYVYARYTAHLQNEKSQVEKYELKSEAIKIKIEEPLGEDLEVWNKIKDDGNFAYLIQYGELRIPSYKPEKRAKFLAEVEDIIAKHPNSFYAESLRQSLSKFRESEEKRADALRKMQKAQ